MPSPNELSRVREGDQITVAVVSDAGPEILDLEIVDRGAIRFKNWVYGRLIDADTDVIYRVAAAKEPRETVGRLVEASPDEEIDLDQLAEDEGDEVIGIATAPSDEIMLDVQAWLSGRLSAAETLDYSAVVLGWRSCTEWAAARGISHQAVSKNVQSAIEKLEG